MFHTFEFYLVNSTLSFRLIFLTLTPCFSLPCLRSQLAWSIILKPLGFRMLNLEDLSTKSMQFFSITSNLNLTQNNWDNWKFDDDQVLHLPNLISYDILFQILFYTWSPFSFLILFIITHRSKEHLCGLSLSLSQSTERNWIPIHYFASFNKIESRSIHHQPILWNYFANFDFERYEVLLFLWVPYKKWAFLGILWIFSIRLVDELDRDLYPIRASDDQISCQSFAWRKF